MLSTRAIACTLVSLIVLAPGAAASGPPDSPEDLDGEVRPDGTLLLTWQPSDGADGYQVYENGELVAQVASPSLLVYPAPVAAFTVTAFNGAGDSFHSTPFLHTTLLEPACYRLVPPGVEPWICKELIIGTAIWLLAEMLGENHPVVVLLRDDLPALLPSRTPPVLA